MYQNFRGVLYLVCTIERIGEHMTLVIAIRSVVSFDRFLLDPTCLDRYTRLQYAGLSTICHVHAPHAAKIMRHILYCIITSPQEHATRVCSSSAPRRAYKTFFTFSFIAQTRFFYYDAGRSYFRVQDHTLHRIFPFILA